ncbi:hypothetical protein [Kribbia dieselivorans]|uniref:hypothetical protein n=1 Tax=Kribbia dieselivorans TaxID=331526 RepID=UPI001C3F300B|nr:hypothetical protein [Kribbia dieselivorans]
MQGLLVALGVALLTAPALFAAVTSDSKYHYLLARHDINGNLLNLPGFVIHDMRWRLHQGRITPVGVFAQEVQYFLGMTVAQALGIELYVVEAITRALLILAAIAAFAWLARELFGRTGYARAVTIIFAVLYAAGANATVTHRSGWTTFVVLCLGTVAIVLATAALLLHVTRRWPDLSPPARRAWAVGLFIVGVAVVLYYEMTVVAGVFSVVLLGVLWWRARRTGAAAVPLAPTLALSAGGLVTLAVTRTLIRIYGCRGPGCYPGFRLRIDLQWPVDAVRSVVGSMPVASGAGTVARDGVGGLQMSSGALIMFTLIGASSLALAGAMARRTVGERSLDPVASATIVERATALWIAGAVALVATALVMSVSVQAQDSVLTAFTSTYRSTPLLWSMLCLLAAPVLAWLLLRPKWGVGVIVALAIWGALIGGLATPANSMAARADRARGLGISEQTLKIVVMGPRVYDAPARCAASVPLRRRYHNVFDRYTVESPATAYRSLWGEDLCPGRPRR